ncbi:interleukin-1 receptor type 1-like [Tiliqua scincoides]|uniref:interleukin-1 receptor type 1-like n=1 Tax=Tiliqua scincoides TaxID=71010 RepID=UPI00346283E1
MVSVLRFTCWISLVYSTVNCCSQMPVLMTVGEPGSLCCPGASKQSNNVTWYRNGSTIPISTSNYSRIHQQGEFLWFIPTSMEDAGIYECSVNGSKRIARRLEIFKNHDGLCFNRNTVFLERVPLRSNRKLTCPIENNFGNPKALSRVQWYRECSHRLREDKKYHSYDKYLVINQTTEEDKGMYLCQAQFTYMEKQYNVSRAINLTLFVSYANIPPNITYPRNHSIEAELGSHVLMDCNVSTYVDDLIIYWEVNGTHAEDFNSLYKAHLYRRRHSGKWIVGAKFNISEMKSEDYEKFTCFVSSAVTFRSSAYIVLNRPALNIQGYLIGGLASPLFVILASVLIYKFFKVDIVLWYRDSCQPLLRKEISDGKLYDACVLYPKDATNCSYSPDIFVLKVLPDVLEKQCGYNLFIFGRDDLPGQAVVNTVDETIKQSRRMIIVLLPDLSCSSTQIEASEQQIAVYRALIPDEIKVILIELDKIDYTNMPESIKYLKQKHGVLMWRGDFSEESQMATSRFWKNMRYQMPASQSPPSSDFHLLPEFSKSAPVLKG